MSVEFSVVGLSPYHIFLARKHTTNSRSLVVEALNYEPKGHRFKHFPYILLQGEIPKNKKKRFFFFLSLDPPHFFFYVLVF